MKRNLLAILNAGVLLALGTLLSAGCSTLEAESHDNSPDASNPLVAEGPFNITVPATHTKLIELNSAGDSQFAGLYNTFELKATVMNSDVREALVRRQAAYYQWDSAQIATEREKTTQEASSETVFFLSFATPERRNDNLADKKTIWRIFLDAGGRRYVGQAKKDRRLLAEIQAQFPYHTRWNTPYLLTFPVGTTAIETQAMKLTITGPLGTRVLEFKPTQAAAAKIETDSNPSFTPSAEPIAP